MGGGMSWSVCTSRIFIGPQRGLREQPLAGAVAAVIQRGPGPVRHVMAHQRPGENLVLVAAEFRRVFNAVGIPVSGALCRCRSDAARPRRGKAAASWNYATQSTK